MCQEAMRLRSNFLRGFLQRTFTGNGHELGFWTPSGVKFSSKDSDVFYRKIIVVMLESELLTDADKVPYMNDMEELDDEKLDEFLKLQVKIFSVIRF
jgi:hypothetical protein